MNDVPLAFAFVARICFRGDEPTMADQNLGRFEHAFPIAEGMRSVDEYVSRVDGRLTALQQPVEELLGEVWLLGLLFDRWSLRVQPIEQVTHRFRPSLLVGSLILEAGLVRGAAGAVLVWRCR